MKHDLVKTPREWQDAGMMVIDRCIANDTHNVIPVNACVGSGKTDLASYAFGKFIQENIKSRTIQMFVTPRIKLCEQQANGIAGYIEQNFGLKRNVDFTVERRDCTQKDLSFSEKIVNQHTIIVICDESLWGVDKTKPNPETFRFSRMSKFLEQHAKDGYIIGNVALDESHNYTANYEFITGEDMQ